MERGPLALFGAIVAVGLGPAMWLGAQFGNSTDLPNRPPAVSSEQNLHQDNGGAAGSAPQDPTAVLDPKPRANIKPLGNTPIRPSASSSGKPPGHQRPSATPSTGSPSPSPSDSSTPPADPSGPGSPPPSGGGGGGTTPPSPPTGAESS